MVNGISNQNINPGMTEQSIAASSAMIVTGLEKEIKHTVRTDFRQQKADLKQIDDFIRKLDNSNPISEIEKHNEDKRRQHKKKEELARGRKFQLAEAPLMAAHPFEWIKLKKRGGIFDLLIDLESRILREILKFVLQPNLDELIGLAKELNLDLSAWRLEKISIDHRGEILLEGNLSPEERLKILLLDECKILEIGKIITDSPIKRLFIIFRLFRVKTTLKELGITKQEFDRITLAAKQISFLKIVAALKDLHLKRVFSASRGEFTLYSRGIKQLTKKIRKIDIDLPQKGMEWVHKKLETLASEAARYKLELLRSMQIFGYEAEREKTIKWLETTAPGLSKA